MLKHAKCKKVNFLSYTKKNLAKQQFTQSELFSRGRSKSIITVSVAVAVHFAQVFVFVAIIIVLLVAKLLDLFKKFADLFSQALLKPVNVLFHTAV